MRRRSWLVPTCVAALALACGERARHAHPVAPVVIVGVDGLDWRVARPLLAEGRMPHLRGLMERGAFGRCATLVPTLSPILWTTIATGKPLEEHGIGGFVRECDHGVCPYTSSERRGRALWNVADRYGLASAVFGWWITWPVEPVRGVMVSGSTSEAVLEENAKPALLAGVERQVHPPELEARALAVAERAGAPELARAVARERLFAGVRDEDLGPVERRLMQQTLWSIQSDATFVEIALDVLADHAADLTMVYLGTPDVVGHRFWRYYEPAPFRWPHDPAAQQAWQASHPDGPPLASLLANRAGERALARVVPEAYAWFDELLGRLLAAVGPEATVIVVSDHGMHADFTQEPNALWNSGHHLDGPPGVFVAAGPGIARAGDVAAFLAGGEAPLVASVQSIAPTVLALLGIPSARDYARRPDVPILVGAALENASLPMVDTHDDGFREPYAEAVPEEVRRTFVDRFSQLGYLGDEDESAGGDRAGGPRPANGNISPASDGTDDAHEEDARARPPEKAP